MKPLTRRDLINFIGRKLAHKYNKAHIVAVVNILIEELTIDLMAGVKIPIINFGVLQLNKLKPRKIREVNSKKLKIASRSKALRLKLSRRLSKFLAGKVFEFLIGENKNDE